MELPIPPDYIPYLVLVVNTILFKIMRVITLKFLPESISCIFAEIVATLELCTDCAELGVVYEIHGYIGLGVALQLVCTWWCMDWQDAEACPNGPIENCVIEGPSGESVKKIIGQVLGAIATAGWIKMVWSLHLIPIHEALHLAADCQAGLQVTMLYGALIEGFITFISRIVALESGHWNQAMSVGANSVTTTLLVLAALDTTGGCFNPILASALTLGCQGNTALEHFVVYWVGSIVGSFIARFLHMMIENSRKEKVD